MTRLEESRTKRILSTVPCLTPILVLALAATANTQGTDALRDPEEPASLPGNTPVLEIAYKNDGKDI